LQQLDNEGKGADLKIEIYINQDKGFKNLTYSPPYVFKSGTYRTYLKSGYLFKKWKQENLRMGEWTLLWLIKHIVDFGHERQ
jgi:hypothetical protein